MVVTVELETVGIDLGMEKGNIKNIGYSSRTNFYIMGITELSNQSAYNIIIEVAPTCSMVIVSGGGGVIGIVRYLRLKYCVPSGDRANSSHLLSKV